MDEHTRYVPAENIQAALQFATDTDVERPTQADTQLHQPASIRRLRELPEHQTPRGRLRACGPHALSDVELVALLLGSGVAGTNAVQLAQHVLVEHDGWQGLLRADYVTLCQLHGIGEAKAAALQAALEISRRMLLHEYEHRPQIKSPNDVAQLLMREMAHLEQEHLRTVLLDTKNRLQTIVTVYIGSLNASLIRVGEVFKEALKRNSAALIVVHNHPSGDPTPSLEDVMVTHEIVQAGKLLDVEVLDHLVIGQEGCVSLRERGLVAAWK